MDQDIAILLRRSQRACNCTRSCEIGNRLNQFPNAVYFSNSDILYMYISKRFIDSHVSIIDSLQ